MKMKTLDSVDCIVPAHQNMMHDVGNNMFAILA